LCSSQKPVLDGEADRRTDGRTGKTRIAAYYDARKL